MTRSNYIANTPTLATLCCLIPAVWVIYKKISKKNKSRRRHGLISPTEERVLILGASSGIGRVLALKYTKRGAKVCVVAHRSAELELVRSECEAAAVAVRSQAPDDAVFSVLADFADAEALIRVRNKIEESEFTVVASPGTSSPRVRVARS